MAVVKAELAVNQNPAQKQHPKWSIVAVTSSLIHSKIRCVKFKSLILFKASREKILIAQLNACEL